MIKRKEDVCYPIELIFSCPEARILGCLMDATNKKDSMPYLSINMIATELTCTPQGLYPIINRLRDFKLISTRRVANANMYSLNLSNPIIKQIKMLSRVITKTLNLK